MQEEEVGFNVFKAMKYPTTRDSCFRLDLIEVIVPNQGIHIDPLETRLLRNLDEIDEEEAE